MCWQNSLELEQKCHQIAIKTSPKWFVRASEQKEVIKASEDFFFLLVQTCDYCPFGISKIHCRSSSGIYISVCFDSKLPECETNWEQNWVTSSGLTAGWESSCKTMLITLDLNCALVWIHPRINCSIVLTSITHIFACSPWCKEVSHVIWHSNQITLSVCCTTFTFFSPSLYR